MSEKENFTIKKVIKTVVDEEVKMTFIEFVGYNVSMHRKAKGFSQEEFSSMITLSRTSLSNVETGRHGLTLTTLREICEMLECESKDILGF